MVVAEGAAGHPKEPRTGALLITQRADSPVQAHEDVLHHVVHVRRDRDAACHEGAQPLVEREPGLSGGVGVHDDQLAAALGSQQVGAQQLRFSGAAATGATLGASTPVMDVEVDVQHETSPTGRVAVIAAEAT